MRTVPAAAVQQRSSGALPGAIDTARLTGASGGGPTTTVGATTSTDSTPSIGLQHPPATSTKNPTLTVCVQAAEIRRAIQSAARAARIDVVQMGQARIERHEQEHAQRLEELFPIRQSQQQMVAQLASAFARIRKAANLPDDVSLHTLAPTRMGR